jgi:isopentenyl phosphate kinase
MTKDLYLLKIGGSVITDIKIPQKARRNAIRDILRQIKEARKSKKFDLIIGHGSGSFAHIPAKKYRVNEGIVNRDSRKGAAITHLVAKSLNTIVIEEGIKMGLSFFPFSPSSFGVWEGRKAKTGAFDSMQEALKNGFIPVTHGDVVLNSSKGVSIASTEDVFSLIASKLKPKKIILATDVDGLFDKDPKTNKDSKLITRISSRNINKVLGYAKGSRKVDVTGGMHSKVNMLYGMIKATRGTGMIVNGTRKNSIKMALLGRGLEKATVIRP